MGAALLVLAGIAGCGGSTPSQVVVRVGDVPISKGTVDHWTRAIELGAQTDVTPGSSHDTPREEALGFLISSHWIIGEAAEQGLAVSDLALEHGLKKRIEAFPDGDAGFQKELSSTDQTISDVKFETRATLAAAMLQERVLRRVPAVTQAQIADFYRRHLRLFGQDRRIVDLIEGVESPAAATALGRRIGTGSRFAKRAIRETVARPSLFEAEYSENRKLVQAIFATHRGELGGPVSYNNLWVLLVVRAMVPGPAKPLAEVRAEIVRHLAKERRGLAIANFIETHRERWTARTSCRAGFVVQKCSQYHGPIQLEEDPLASR